MACVADKVHGPARQEVQPVAVGGVNGHRCSPAPCGSQAHHCLQQMALPLLDVLAHGVQVRGELHAGREQALALLALALAVELLPPLGHEPEGRLIGRPGSRSSSRRCIELVPGRGILPGRDSAPYLPAVQTSCIRRPPAIRARDVDARHGDGQQAHGGEDAVAPADVVRHHEGLIPRPDRPGTSGLPSAGRWWRKCAGPRRRDRISSPAAPGRTGRPRQAPWWCRTWR